MVNLLILRVRKCQRWRGLETAHTSLTTDTWSVRCPQEMQIKRVVGNWLSRSVMEEKGPGWTAVLELTPDCRILPGLLPFHF